MTNFLNSVRHFIASEDGPTAVEYAVMLALIIVACVTTIKALATALNSEFTSVTTTLSS